MQRFPSFFRCVSATVVLIAGCDSPQPFEPGVEADGTSAARQYPRSEITAPTSFTAAAVSDTQIDMTWQDNSNDETKFEIYRTTPTVQFSPTVLLSSPGANVTTYSDKGVTYGLEYCYWVRAVRATGNKVITSGPSNTVCAATPVITAPPPLFAPTNVRIGLYSAREFTILWDYTSASETGFELHRSTTGPAGIFTLRGQASPWQRGVGDSDLTPFTEYCYMIRAVQDVRGVRFFSPFSNVTCGRAVPAPAEGATARPVSSEVVEVQWYAVGHNFRIERSIDGGASWSTAQGTMTGLATFQATAQSEQVACYRVINYLEGYDAAPSNSACTAAPRAPTGVTATTEASGIVNLSWIDNSSVEDGYEVRGWLIDCWQDWDGIQHCDGYSEYVLANLPPGTVSFSGAGLDLSVYAMKDGGYSSRGTPAQ